MKEAIFALVLAFLSPQTVKKLPVPTPVETTAKRDCSYNLENDKRLRVVVPEVKKDLYSNREKTEWVRFKTDAVIPAWKVWGGGNPDGGGEMVEIGTSDYSTIDPGHTNLDATGRRVFIGRGHCSGKAGETCLDPLVQNTIFVATVEGAGKKNVPPDEKDSGTLGYWWVFNVYYDLSKLPPNPKSSDLPTWVKECQGVEQGRDSRPKATVRETIATYDNPPINPSFILAKDIQYNDRVTRKKELKESYIFDETIPTKPTTGWAELLGTYFYQGTTYDVWLSLEGFGFIILDPKNGSNAFYAYKALGQVIIPRKTSLQLGTFNPIRQFLYEWWTPACKPALYLYPEKPTELTVKVKPKGYLTQSIPAYPKDGWQVMAFPDGKIQQSSDVSLQSSAVGEAITFPYLYYEASLQSVHPPEEGWIVRSEDLSDFFAVTLPGLGLNSQEQKDFRHYWLPKLSDGSTWFIGLIDQHELNRVEPLEFSVQPDTLLRVRFYFRKQDQLAPNAVWPLTRYDWQKPAERKGFTVVDWGGILSQGACGEVRSE